VDLTKHQDKGYVSSYAAYLYWFLTV